MITLTNTATSVTLTLPDALNWSDEYAWSPVMQTTTKTTTGALIIEVATQQAGRPITLEGSDDSTWCTRAMVDTLRAWATTPGLILSLTLRGTERSVMFDHERAALQGLPVIFYADGSISPDDFYYPTLRFLEL